MHVDRLDDLECDLQARAGRPVGDERTVLYEFAVAVAGSPLVRGGSGGIGSAVCRRLAHDGPVPALAVAAN